MASGLAEAETRQRLLRTVKKEVKQIMEEAVTRKFVHEDSSHIISFCAAVEACVLHGLRRRAAGFLRSNKIAALFMKVGKSFPPAEELSRKVQDLEQLIDSARNQIQGLQENVRKLPKLPNLSPLAIKHLWIRTALFEKVLDKIVHYLVENSRGSRIFQSCGSTILWGLMVICFQPAEGKWKSPSPGFLLTKSFVSPHLPQSYEEQELLRLVYYGGIQPEIRKAVWPFLLGHYQFGMTETERKEVDEQMHACYAQTMSEWLGCEAIVRQRERESHAAALAKCSSGASLDSHLHRMIHRDSTISNESSQSCSSGRQNIRLQSDSSSSTQVFESVDEVEQVEAECRLEEKQPKIPNGSLVNGTCSPDSGHPSSHNFSSGLSEHSEPSLSTEDSVMDAQRPAPLVIRPRDSGVDDGQSSEATTSRDEVPREELAVQDSLESDLLANGSMDEFVSITGSMDVALPEREGPAMEGWRGIKVGKQSQVDSEDNLSEEPEMESLFPVLASLAVTTSANNEASPVSSSGVTYSPELLDLYTVNLHRIEKDVQRCDRNYSYFTPANLEKLRNIMCSYIWQHIDIGYVQGMCDLLAPLLVILDDEALAFSCFTELMKRMNQNFPHGGAMDTHFANMRSLIQILDSELFELMHQNGDYTHFYFCYRWFLLDFKRELIYDDVFSVWETIWAAKHVSSAHYVLFIALALVEVYRDIILENNMDFTDIIKFFNEMAERHNTKQVLKLARDLVYKVQTLIENK
eukprot:XP_028336335.1 small G protein signaling modulator 1 [Physeter catodon]